MVTRNFFIFFDKYLNLNKKKFIKKHIKIKMFKRSVVTTSSFKGLFLAIHNGLFFIPILIDANRINYMLAVFAFSFSIKLKKKIKIYKKKKKK